MAVVGVNAGEIDFVHSGLEVGDLIAARSSPSRGRARKHKGVVTRAASKHIGGAVSRDRIVAGSPDHVFDALPIGTWNVGDGR